MSQVIAVAGKGGSGKTTLAALLVRALKEEGRGSILAIDADPNSNLGELLGVKGASTIVEIVDNISKNPNQIPAGVTKDRFIGMKVHEALDEAEGFDLLTMGRPEGPGCYCFVNNILRDLIKRLMDGFSYVVIDNEAGMEHLSRRLVRTIDRFFIVSDAGIASIRAAERISRLADELKIATKERSFILNKAKGEVNLLKDGIRRTGLELKMILPFSKELENMSIKGSPIFSLSENNPVLNAVKRMSHGTVERKLGAKN